MCSDGIPTRCLKVCEDGFTGFLLYCIMQLLCQLHRTVVGNDIVGKYHSRRFTKDLQYMKGPKLSQEHLNDI